MKMADPKEGDSKEGTEDLSKNPVIIEMG